MVNLKPYYIKHLLSVAIVHSELNKTKQLLEKNLYPSNFIDQQIKQYLHAQFSDEKPPKKNLVTLHMFYITNCLILKIYWQKLNKKLWNIANTIVKVLISKLSFRRLKLEIYLVLRNLCLSNYYLSLSTNLHVLAVTPVIFVKQLPI